MGEACTVDDQCRFRRCETGTCARSEYAPLPYADVLGQACGDGAGGCGSGVALRCLDGSCEPLPDEGAACDSACRMGQMCVDDHCVEVGCSLDLGEPCIRRCGGGDCVDGICVPAGTEVGDGCVTACAESLVCVDSRCETAPDRSLGAACDFGLDCASGYCERDVSAYCSDGACSIPACDRCGECAPRPTVASCE